MRFNSQQIEPQAKTFKYWLIDQLKANDKTMFDWQTHSFARHNHPTPEHLLPVFFARGAGDVMSVVHESFAHYNLGMDIYRFDYWIKKGELTAVNLPYHQSIAQTL